jgi:hypothetical protein
MPTGMNSDGTDMKLKISLDVEGLIKEIADVKKLLAMNSLRQEDEGFVLNVPHPLSASQHDLLMKAWKDCHLGKSSLIILEEGVTLTRVAKLPSLAEKTKQLLEESDFTHVVHYQGSLIAAFTSLTNANDYVLWKNPPIDWKVTPLQDYLNGLFE